jgi:transporter family protein
MRRLFCRNFKLRKDTAMNLNQLPWWFFALGSAVFAALTTLLAKIGLQGVNSDLATAIRTIVVLLFAWGIVLARNESGDLQHLSTRTIVFLILSGLATGASWLLYFRALQLGEAGPVAALDKFSLVLIVLLSALFLAEPLTWKVVLGAALITAGTLLMIR